MRAAKNIVKDIGEQAARQSGGLVELSRCSERDAEQSTRRLLVGKLKLALPIPLRALPVRLERGEPERLYCLHLSDWARFILKANCWHILCGLRKPNEQRERAIWTEFWSRYRKLEPNHPIYTSGYDLSRCAALITHGDEGRSKRRAPILVCSYRSVLGLGTIAATTTTSRSGRRQKVLKGYLKMTTNYVGHTYTNRLLCGVLPRADYGPDDANYHVLMSVFAEQAAFMAETGVPDTKGNTYRMLVVKHSGDWPWLHKSGCFMRSFNNSQKKAVLKKPPAGICHLCQAGQSHVPFEDFLTSQPKWLATVFTESPFSTLPELAVIPHCPNKLEGMWTFDIFHCWNLGLGKNYLGSILAMMAQREAAGNIDQRFELLSSRYSMFCHEQRMTPYIKKITKELLQWDSTSDYPSGTWFKGALTTVLFEFVQHRAETEDFSDDPILMCALEGGAAMREALRLMYANDVFLGRALAERVAKLGLKFLRRYAQAAAKAHEQGLALFVIMPKGHAIQHIMIDLLLSSQAAAFSINPMVWGVQAEEDFIGRPSRLSRRTPTPTGVQRVIERYLQSAYRHWVKVGYIVEAE